MKSRRLYSVFAALALALFSIGLPATAREPVQTRLVSPEDDAPTLARIEARRSLLAPRFQRRNNFAWALVDIPGCPRHEFIAHSGIWDRDDCSAESWSAISNIVAVGTERDRQLFSVLAVNSDDVVDGPDSWYRHVDTECKILENLSRILDTLPSPPSGRIRLYTDLAPCASCRHVISQFLDRYPLLQMQVLYREP